MHFNANQRLRDFGFRREDFSVQTGADSPPGKYFGIGHLIFCTNFGCTNLGQIETIFRRKMLELGGLVLRLNLSAEFQNIYLEDYV